MVRSLFRRILARLTRHETGIMAVRGQFWDIKQLLAGATRTLMIDGGANNGQTIATMLSHFPAPEIHAFEPNPDCVQTLQTKFGGRKDIHIHPLALGEESRPVSFNVTRESFCSSILGSSRWSKKYLPQQTEILKTIEARMARLDEVIPAGIIDLLKLDLQGYEMQALKGAEKLLESVKIIAAEAEFIPFYENQPLFGDLDCYLRSKGFRLLNLYSLYTQEDGQLVAGDATYLNERFF